MGVAGVGVGDVILGGGSVVLAQEEVLDPRTHGHRQSRGACLTPGSHRCLHFGVTPGTDNQTLGESYDIVMIVSLVFARVAFGTSNVSADSIFFISLTSCQLPWRHGRLLSFASFALKAGPYTPFLSYRMSITGLTCHEWLYPTKTEAAILVLVGTDSTTSLPVQ